MSHNFLKVQNKKPNRDGEISVDISELNGVSIPSPSNGEVLTYNSVSTNWESQVAPSPTTTVAQYIFIGKGQSADYSTSGYDGSGFDADDILYLYDTTPMNTISGATINKYTTTDWVESIDLPKGTYSMLINFYVEDFNSSAGYLGFQLKDSSNVSLSDAGYVGVPSTLPTYYEVGLISNIMVLSQDTTVYLKVAAADAVANTQGTTPSTTSSLYIEKIAD
jgi:hypothetical protein